MRSPHVEALLCTCQCTMQIKKSPHTGALLCTCQCIMQVMMTGLYIWVLPCTCQCTVQITRCLHIGGLLCICECKPTSYKPLRHEWYIQIGVEEVCSYTSLIACDPDQNILSWDEHLSLLCLETELWLMDRWEWDSRPCTPKSFVSQCYGGESLCRQERQHV
jgi:hypothetical protein